MSAVRDVELECGHTHTRTNTQRHTEDLLWLSRLTCTDVTTVSVRTNRTLNESPVKIVA